MQTAHIWFILALLLVNFTCTGTRNRSRGTVIMYGAPEGTLPNPSGPPPADPLEKINDIHALLEAAKSGELDNVSDEKVVALASKISFVNNDIVKYKDSFSKLRYKALTVLVDKIESPDANAFGVASEAGFNKEILKKMIERMSEKEARKVLMYQGESPHIDEELRDLVC
jgi:hypothetical protein